MAVWHSTARGALARPGPRPQCGPPRQPRTRHKTIGSKITVHYPFHPLHGQHLEVASAVRSEDTAVSVIDPDGLRLKIPLWMVSPTAAGYRLAAQATISARALRSTFELLLPHLPGHVGDDAGRIASKLSATGSSPATGENDEAARFRLAPQTDERDGGASAPQGARGSRGPHECRARGGISPSKGGKP